MFINLNALFDNSSNYLPVTGSSSDFPALKEFLDSNCMGYRILRVMPEKEEAKKLSLLSA